MPVTAAEVVIELHRPPGDVFGEPEAGRENYTRFRLSPEVVIALGARAKAPGEAMRGEDVELLVSHHPEAELMAPYERLLGGSLDGDPGDSTKSDSRSPGGYEKVSPLVTAVGAFFVLVALVAGLLVGAYALALLGRGVKLAHRDHPPTWPRYHVRFYTFALLFVAFDMEMAYMYPWAAVFRSLGIIAYGEIGFFLTVLGLGILYAWREGALEWS